MTAYIALLFKDPDSDFGVTFPDFPGCVTAGTTMQEARQLAGEALSFHIQGMRKDSLPIPSPSTLDEVMADPEHQDGFGFLVEVPDPSARSVRINITLPEDLIAAIDRNTNNRSRFLAIAARDRLARLGA
jgi:predicted RNase H-like HicB family nuclease